MGYGTTLCPRPRGRPRGLLDPNEPQARQRLPRRDRDGPTARAVGSSRARSHYQQVKRLRERFAMGRLRPRLTTRALPGTGTVELWAARVAPQPGRWSSEARRPHQVELAQGARTFHVRRAPRGRAHPHGGAGHGRIVTRPRGGSSSDRQQLRQPLPPGHHPLPGPLRVPDLCVRGAYHDPDYNIAVNGKRSA